MPELPEVEAVVARARRAAKGRTIRKIEVLRASAVRPQTAALVARRAGNRRIENIERRGKNILIRLAGGYTIRIHLKLNGDLHTDGVNWSSRVIFHLSGGRQLVFDEPRALGTVNVLDEKQLAAALAGIGPEPLSREFRAEDFVEAAGKSRLAAKLFLMDQKRVAGLGNVYAAEALFRARIHPGRRMNELGAGEAGELYGAIREVLREAVKSAKIAYNHPGGHKEAARFKPSVYGREGEPCVRCGSRIRRIQQGGRSTYFCAHCQR